MSSSNKTTTRLLPALLLAATLACVLFGYNGQTEQLNNLQRTMAQLKDVAIARSEIEDIKEARRDYLAVSKAAELDRYRAAVETLRGHVQSIRKKYPSRELAALTSALDELPLAAAGIKSAAIEPQIDNCESLLNNIGVKLIAIQQEQLDRLAAFYNYLVWGVLILVGFSVLLLSESFFNKRARQPEERHDRPAGGETVRGVIEDALIGMALVDSAERIVRANPALQQLLGYTATEFEGMALNHISHVSDLSEDRTLIGEVLEGRRHSYTVEKRLMSKTGETLWVRLSATALPNFESGGRGALIMIDDRTRQREIETELRSGRKAIQNLYEVVAAEHMDFADKIRSLLELGCKQFNLETRILGKATENKFEVKQVVSPDPTIRRGDTYELGSEEESTNEQAPAPAGLQHTGLPNDWRNLPSFSEIETESYLGAPIMVNGQMYGTLNFSSPQPRREPFEESDTQLIKLMAQWVGNEIGRRQAQAELEAKQLELAAANKQLEMLATHDGLTGVKNRRAFNEQLDVEFRRARRYNTQLSLILLDVDKFKHYNDNFGHPAGDEVLKKVASILQNGVRNIDFVARYGGEEFVVLLPNTDPTGAMILADRLRAKIEKTPWTLREVTASFGVATLDADIAESSMLTSSADQALYHSKEEGRNRVTHAHALEPDVVYREA